MKPIYIFDLDGTLADTEHRLHYIQGETKDWRGFFSACVDDAPILPTIFALKALRYAQAEIWIWTGRSDEVREETRAWLAENEAMPDMLRMRKAGDYRPDHVIKAEWLQEVRGGDLRRIAAVWEDRDRVVQMWREAGLQCFQVAPGAF